MPQTSGNFSVGDNGGAVTLGGNAESQTVQETNVSVWRPATPGAFEKARNAKVFTRIGTWHSSDQLKAALDSAPQVNQTFCMSVNNVLVAFSPTIEEHKGHVRALLHMLRANGMKANLKDCIFNGNKWTDVGIQLQQVGSHEVYMIINEGLPKNDTSHPTASQP